MPGLRNGMTDIVKTNMLLEKNQTNPVSGIKADKYQVFKSLGTTPNFFLNAVVKC